MAFKNSNEAMKLSIKIANSNEHIVVDFWSYISLHSYITKDAYNEQFMLVRETIKSL
jgi:hypothetical protein